MNNSNHFFLLRPEFSNEKLIETWHKRTRVAQRAHYRTAVSYEKKHFLVTVLLLTVNVLIIGFISFIDIQSSWKLIINVLVILSSFLSGMQTFLQSDRKAENHRRVASRFSILQKELEKFYVFYNSIDDKNEKKNIFKEFIDEFIIKHNQLIADAPTPGEKEFQEESLKYKKLIEYDK